jgi:hypothetical protein
MGASGFAERSDVRSCFRLPAIGIVENVNVTTFEDRDTAEHLAHDCAWEAKTRGTTKADLIEAAGGDLNAYILAELNRAVGREVEDRIAEDVS